MRRIAILLVLACACVVAGSAGAVPESRGTLVVASDATHAPYAFTRGGGQTVVGVDADLARAIANVLGYRVNVVDASRDAIVHGLVAGEYDLGMSLPDTAARERVVDLVSYRSAGGGAGSAPYGIAAAKAGGMAAEVLDALRTLVADGTYRSILARWGVQARAIAVPRLDAAAG
jgi:ABC-type amino acid transport substrate-binding protein